MAANYEVTAQQQSSRITPGGTLEDVMIVSYTVIPEGVNAQVIVPLATYSASTVADEIERNVTIIKAVQGL